MIYRFEQTYEQTIWFEVEADSLEEAKQLAENKEEWEEDSERFLSLDRYKFAETEDDLEDADWEVVYNAYSE